MLKEFPPPTSTFIDPVSPSAEPTASDISAAATFGADVEQPKLSAVTEHSSKDPTHGQELSTTLRAFWARFGEGGTLMDAVLMEASQQIGQSVLTLPWIFSLMGYGAATVFLLVFSVVSMYTQYLLISLLGEYRKRLAAQDHPRATDKHYIASYHEVIGFLLGKRWGVFAFVIVFFALLGLSTVQIISTASNLYLLNDYFDKRTYSLIIGAILVSVTFLPTFRHYRVFNMLALLATFYTAWYMTIASAVEGPVQDVEYNGPNVGLQKFFTAFTSLLFMFGGHTAAIEKADVMDRPSKYGTAYAFATLYVYCITLPNGVTTYHSFGSLVEDSSNGFYLFPATVYRDIGLLLMCLHELVAFGLFCGPLFHMWEKALRIEGTSLWLLKIGARVLVVGLMLLIAVAFPFFGVINGFLGAFTTTFGSFIIPCVAYNVIFQGSDNRPEELFPKSIQLGPGVIRNTNWVVAFLILVLGVGFGGYSALKTLLDEVNTFHFFASCYGC